MKTIIVENDVFSEDEQVSKNSAQVASKYFNVIQINSLFDLLNDESLIKEIAHADFYRGSFASGALIRRENSFIRNNEKLSFFNCQQWVPALKQFYINRAYNFVDMERCLDLDSFPLFIRPCTGNKSFSGQLFSSKDHFKTEFDFTTVNRNISKYEMCLYAKPKLISEEYRCVFVDNTLVAACGYLKNGERDDFACPLDAIDEAIKISQNSYFNIPNFVIDVCRNGKDDSLKLLEINSVYNASFYSCDLDAIYDALAIYLNNYK